MHIDVIDTLEGFNRIKGDWDAVYAGDPDAEFFLSWTWISNYLDQVNSPWFVLAVKPSRGASAYVAFLPLRLRTKLRKGDDFHFYNEINMAGHHAADYTGLICNPAYEDRAVPALGRYLNKLNWTRLHLDNLYASERRTQLLLKLFPSKRFDTTEREVIDTTDNINHSICPRVTLPADWDTYLTTKLGSNTRQKVRRFLRKIEESDEFRITHADPDTIERDIKILLRFWELKWAPRKGNRIPALLRFNSTILSRCFASGSLFLPVLWKGETPLAALATLVDPVKRSLLFYIGARDETFNNPPPGFILHAHSIRCAIINGFATYDFLRGNEPYKYAFGPDERRLRCLRVTTKSRRNLGDKLHPRSVPAVLRRATELHKAGQLAEAERGYRQILETDARYAPALDCLGQLMAAKGDHGAAKKLFRTLVAVQPDSHRAWFRLGQSLQACGEVAAAAEAYREAVARQHEFPVAHYGLGCALLKLGEFDEALAAFETALDLKPDYATAEIGRANALSMMQRATPARPAHHSLRNAGPRLPTLH
jgi:tetratricopeptide (TPR) repeat protein